MSLPSRGAWIEIREGAAAARQQDVAPLAGSVDRNPFACKDVVLVLGSLPSRGAWIEI